MYNTTNMTVAATAAVVLPNTSSTTDRLPEVQGEVERIGYGLEALQKLVDHMESRLSPVLAQRAVQGNAGDNQPEPIRVPLADVLHQRVLAVDALCRQLQSIIERVEL